MREWYAGIGGDGDRRGDARDDLEGNTDCGKVLRFLASPTEDNGVAALQTNDHLVLTRFLCKKGIDLFLRKLVPGGLLARVDDLRAGVSVLEEALVHQVIIDDDIGLPDEFETFHCNELHVAGACAHEIYLSHENIIRRLRAFLKG